MASAADGGEWGTPVGNVREFLDHKVDPHDVDPIVTKSLDAVIARLEEIPFFEVGRVDAEQLRAATIDNPLQEGRYFVVRAVSIAPPYAYAPYRVFFYEGKLLISQGVMGAGGKPRKSALLIRLGEAPREVLLTWSSAQ